MGLLIKLFIDDNRDELNVVVLKDQEKEDESTRSKSNVVANVIVSLCGLDTKRGSNKALNEKKSTKIAETEAEPESSTVIEESRSEESQMTRSSCTPSIRRNEKPTLPIKIEKVIGSQLIPESTEDNDTVSRLSPVNLVAKFGDVVYELTPVAMENQNSKSDILHLVDQNTCRTPPRHVQDTGIETEAIINASQTIEIDLVSDTDSEDDLDVKLPRIPLPADEMDRENRLTLLATNKVEAVAEVGKNSKAKTARKPSTSHFFSSGSQMRFSDPDTDSDTEMTIQDDFKMESFTEVKESLALQDVTWNVNRVASLDESEVTNEPEDALEFRSSLDCDFSSSCGDILKTDEGIGSIKKLHSCSQCSFRTAWLHSLKRHLRRQHRRKRSVKPV